MRGRIAGVAIIAAFVGNIIGGILIMAAKEFLSR
jgi:formate/nitrite transporter FocA (FNT family)